MIFFWGAVRAIYFYEVSTRKYIGAFNQSLMLVDSENYALNLQLGNPTPRDINTILTSGSDAVTYNEDTKKFTLAEINSSSLMQKFKVVQLPDYTVAIQHLSQCLGIERNTENFELVPCANFDAIARFHSDYNYRRGLPADEFRMFNQAQTRREIINGRNRPDMRTSVLNK